MRVEAGGFNRPDPLGHHTSQGSCCNIAIALIDPDRRWKGRSMMSVIA